jgi:hypothetical protein
MFLCFSGLCADQLTEEMKLSQLLAHPVTPARRAADTETRRASEKLPETPARRAADTETRRASEKLPETPARRATHPGTRRDLSPSTTPHISHQPLLSCFAS